MKKESWRSGRRERPSAEAVERQATAPALNQSTKPIIRTAHAEQAARQDLGTKGQEKKRREGTALTVP